MSYTLVETIDGNDRVYHLENPDGDIVANYESKPSHPPGTAEDVADDMGLEGKERVVFLYSVRREWDFESVDQS